MDRSPDDPSWATLSDRTLDDVLTKITCSAAREIPGADSTSITLLRGDEAVTAAYAGELALHADELQYEHGYGPCLDAARAGVVLRVDDMRTEPRWPDYAAQAARYGVRSSLSVPLPYQGPVLGALDTYSTRAGAFATAEALETALAVADVVAIAIANALAPLGNEAADMRLAMQTRAVIEQAKGVLMAQRHLDPDQAFEVLRETSRRHERRLRDTAAAIVASIPGAPREPGAPPSAGS